MTSKNLFIVFDGLDGSGKGEIIARVHNYLFFSSTKYRILTTREPTSGKYGIKIREILKTQKDPKADAELMLNLFVKDREEHLKTTILPFLEKKTEANHNIVLCDRYYYSTIAFQAAQGIPIQKIVEKNKKFLKPDLALILDLDPKLALERIENSRDVKEKFEQSGVMKDIRANFLNLGKYLKDNLKIINASKSKDAVFEQVKKEIDKVL